MHSIKDADVEILIDNDDADPDYSGIAFIFQMNEGEDLPDIWEINKTAPGNSALQTPACPPYLAFHL
ncbi:hypothetical protein [Oligoflexus tunisiensis]|uniref:hypothetical protein n=1 Tax=Oligoflexus tunisiensis TaxID=708132 RepID=UPI001C402825|nr:hypothetical protein [Oligoflexus tunisiensis]